MVMRGSTGTGWSSAIDLRRAGSPSGPGRTRRPRAASATARHNPNQARFRSVERVGRSHYELTRNRAGMATAGLTASVPALGPGLEPAGRAGLAESAEPERAGPRAGRGQPPRRWATLCRMARTAWRISTNPGPARAGPAGRRAPTRRTSAVARRVPAMGLPRGRPRPARARPAEAAPGPARRRATRRPARARWYCGPIGVEFMHIPDPARRRWVQERMEQPIPPVDARRCSSAWCAPTCSKRCSTAAIPGRSGSRSKA